MLFRLASAICLTLVSCAASAIDQVQIHWGKIDAAGWQLSDVSLSIDWQDSSSAAMALEVSPALQSGSLPRSLIVGRAN